ncbi:somatostatin 1.2 isoform X2 [Dunckerocampus dactyliophorus]|uniref:somatostatin 1.2 isoform X2 n=1 Tax=Dunckerocampus dactyliophorus TaxID=161453 RepID=UPI002404F64F|nr:somatostatin 1.2 isoform X2 [Dunckerocampus dactyliophorus]
MGPEGGGARAFKRTAGRRAQPQTSLDPEQEPEPGAAEEEEQANMHRGPGPAILVLMALVLCSPAVSPQPDREQDEYQNQDLNLELRHHQMLQQAHGAGVLSQDWTKRAVEDLLARMALPEADSQREAELVAAVTGSGRMNLERSVDPPNSLPPRERKAGCKNFYWKGFTSC